jgi:hypothetical protein
MPLSFFAYRLMVCIILFYIPKVKLLMNIFSEYMNIFSTCGSLQAFAAAASRPEHTVHRHTVKTKTDRFKMPSPR